ncbi:MAG: hypothetical protein IJA61_02545 [Clostridia bacterium]|nr:hypothetical protein [Clostridia bacterium]
MDRNELEYWRNLERENNIVLAQRREENKLKQMQAEQDTIPTYDEFFLASKPPVYNQLVSSANSPKDPNQKLAQEALDKFEAKTKAAYFEKYPQAIAVGDRAKIAAMNWVSALTPAIFAAGVYCVSKFAGVFEADIQSIQAAAASFATIGGASALINFATRDKIISDIQNKTIAAQREEKAKIEESRLKARDKYSPTPGYEDPMY